MMVAFLLDFSERSEESIGFTIMGVRVFFKSTFDVVGALEESLFVFRTKLDNNFTKKLSHEMCVFIVFALIGFYSISFDLHYFL